MLADRKLKAFIPTVDSERAKHFYKDVIGLKLLSEQKYFLDFDARGSLLRIISVESFTPQPFTVLGWVVDDIFSTIEELNTRGVFCEKYEFFEQDDLGVWISPAGFKVAWFKDPDGNLLSINEDFVS